MVPSDWSAQHVQKPDNPRTVADLKRAIDAAVVKQGTFTLVFHPHKWIKAEQIVELIDHAVDKHGPKVKFLNFREAAERLNKNLLAGNPLRAANGRDNGVRLLDANADGYMDVVIGNETTRRTRLWSPEVKKWIDGEFPLAVVSGTPRARPWMPACGSAWCTTTAARACLTAASGPGTSTDGKWANDASLGRRAPVRRPAPGSAVAGPRR